MTEKLQLVDAGLAEHERTGGLPRCRARLEKSKRLPHHCANPVATGHSSNKMTVDDDDDDGNSFLLLFILSSGYTKSSGRSFILGHVY
jgi:hypothetical protein